MTELNPPKETSNGVASLAGSFFGAAFVAAAFILIALFAFSLCGRYSFAAELVSNFRAQILIGLFVCIIGAISFQRWWIGILLVIATFWCSVGVLSVYLQVVQPAPGDTKIRIMSYNVLAENQSYQDVKKQIAKLNPDVVVIVEYDHQWHETMQSLIDDATYPHSTRAPRWHGFGIAIFSKLPLTNTRTIQLTPEITDAPMVTAEFMVGQQKLRLAGLHVFSPVTANRLQIRNDQFTDAADFLSKSTIPTVVVGDFNCAPWSPFLDDFQNRLGYRDSRTGFGYQGSWNARYYWPTLIPIDHAFVSPEVHIHDRFLGEPAGSDHYPIVVDLSLTPN